MRVFSRLYGKALVWAGHRHAPWYLAGVSFAESSFFPLPPDVLLAPMVLARRESAWRYATVTTVASVIGGIVGYTLGMLAFDAIRPLIQDTEYWTYFLNAKTWFGEWGVWVVLIAGFSPIPYKVFTITAGTLSMSFLPFVVASAIGRGARFFLVSSIIRWGGERFERGLRDYIDHIGWLVVIAAALIYFFAQ